MATATDPGPSAGAQRRGRVRGPGRRNTPVLGNAPARPNRRVRKSKCVVATPLYVDMGGFTLESSVRYHEAFDMFDLRDVLDMVYGNKDQGIRAMWRLKTMRRLGSGAQYARVRWHDPNTGTDANKERKGRVVCTRSEVARMLRASTAHYRNTAPKYLEPVCTWFANEATVAEMVFM